MKEHLTELVWVLDAPKEAEGLASGVLRGYNKAVAALCELPGEMRLTTVIAGEEPRFLYQGKDAAAVTALTKRIYKAKETCDLAAALRAAIDGVGVRLSKTPEEERPSKVVLAVLSLGKAGIGGDDELIQSIAHQRDVYNWSFLFLGAGGSGAKKGEALGIGGDWACGFASDESGAESAMEAVAKAMEGLIGDSLAPDWKKGVAKRAKKPKAKRTAGKKEEAKIDA